jgi:DNA-binding HxlR family transcriptional regulator
MNADRTYRHFCMMARALEVIGERWTLLIVRDLLLDRKRFSDLERGLNDITPARLTDRLRLLKSAGIVTRAPSDAGREVWYGLTDAGRDLAPVLDALALWGMTHRLERPVPGEPVHPDPAILGTKVWLNNFAPKLVGELVWAWRFPGEEEFTLRLEAGTWQLGRGADAAATVTVRATAEAWATFLTSPREGRRLPSDGIGLHGSRTELRRFARGFLAELAYQRATAGAIPPAHNPEVVGSNPTPATRRARRAKAQRALRYAGGAPQSPSCSGCRR